jgi:hypothetical protein
MILRALATWFLLFLVALLGAMVREGVFLPRVGEPAAHVMGTALVVGVMVPAIGLIVPWVVPSLEPGRLWLLGGGWVAATIAFEFGFGHFVMGHPWSRLFHDYNLFAGRVWIFVLLAIFFAPVVLGRLQARG